MSDLRTLGPGALDKAEPPAMDRALRLKFLNATPRHLTEALDDPDPTVREAAARHPHLSARQALLAVQHQDDRVVLAALRNEAAPIDIEHLDAVAGHSNPEVRIAVAQHPKVTAEQLARLYADSPPEKLASAIVRQAHAPAAILRDAVVGATQNPTEGNMVLVSDILKGHPGLTPKVLSEVINRFGMYPPDVRRLAIIHSLVAPEDLSTVLRNYTGPHGFRLDALDNPGLSDELLALAGNDPHPEVRQKAHERALERWLGKSESLSKAVKPADLKNVVRGIDHAGKQYVEHRTQMAAGVPAHVQPSVDLFRSAVLESSRRGLKDKLSGVGQGISRKTIFKVGEDRFMVKPYHERVDRRLSKWVHVPTQGWAEMANQALYHAAGIGHLHQRVHVAELPMDITTGRWNVWPHLPSDVVYESSGNRLWRLDLRSRGGGGLIPEAEAKEIQRQARAKVTKTSLEPALVIHLARGFKSIFERPLGEDYSVVEEDGRRIAVMDALTNNLDRHSGNLLYSPEREQLLAIDHSRSFQYLNVGKWNLPRQIASNAAYDTLGNYLGYGRMCALYPVLMPPVREAFDRYDLQRRGWADRVDDFRNKFKPTLEEWWPSVVTSVSQALYDQLHHIKDEKVRTHIRKNFDARAEAMNQYAEFGLDNHGSDDWHQTTFPLFRPWETERED